jgi:pimeloyl-ACP methyl ester carboxylesterase
MRAAASVAALWAVRVGGLPVVAAGARMSAARAMRTAAAAGGAAVGGGGASAPGCATRSAAALTRMRRTAETMLSAVRARAARSPCRPGDAAGGRHGRQQQQPPRRAGLAAAGAGLLAVPLESLRRSFSHRRVSIQEAAADCDRLLASVVRTRYRTYWRQRLFTIECDPPYPGAPVLVVTHGYAAGSGMFAFDLDALASRYHVFCVDWLGCGASERPPWTATTVADGERWFTDSLAEWAAAGGLTDTGFVLLGHSLGGYLSAAYALRHPGHVRHLVLASPAGIPSPPDPAALAARQSGWLMGLLRRAWERGVTPQALVRALGPWGEAWAGEWRARFVCAGAASEFVCAASIHTAYLLILPRAFSMPPLSHHKQATC